MSSFKLRKEKDCLNCGHSVDDHFCPHCGQENIELKEDAVHMVAHAVADYFHFEHKFFGTIYPLLFKPGTLTTAYVTGKRVKFIHPIRLYIFISIVFFLFAFSGFNKDKEHDKKVHQVEKKEKFIEDLLHNVPKMMFLLLPLFALILKLVYINKKRFYYEHLIYSFHVHSAIFLSILISMLLQWLTGFVYDLSGWITSFCTLYIIWYIYRSLRTFYGSTRWITVLKIFFLSFAYNVVLTLCFLIVIAISFAMV